LGDFEDLLQIGRDLEIDSLRSIEQSIDDVSKKVAELQECVVPFHSVSSSLQRLSFSFFWTGPVPPR